MVSLTSEERAEVDSLLSCLATAMDRCEDVDPEYANKTKLQKLLYLAIDEFNLPVTHSWYLAGAVVPTDQATPDELQNAFDGPAAPSVPADTAATASADAPAHEDSPLSEYLDPVGETDPLDPILFSGGGTPETSGESETGDESGAADDFDESDGPETVVDDHRDEIVDFYVQNLPDVWHKRTMRFLQNFYLGFAPEQYQDVYVYSTHLRIHLRDIEKTVAAHVDGDEPEHSIPELVDKAGLVISDLHTALRATDPLAETFRPFVAGTNVIEDGLMMLEQQSLEDFEAAHVDAVRSMQEFFYYVVWRYPCLIISRETATGPSAGAMRDERSEQLDGFEETIQERIDELEAELDAVGLLPDYTDYPPLEDDIDETITDLAGEYFQQ